MGIVVVATFAARVEFAPAVMMTSGFETHELSRVLAAAFGIPVCGAPVDDDAFPLHVPRLAQTLTEGFEAGEAGGRRSRHRRNPMRQTLRPAAARRLSLPRPSTR